MDFPEGEGWRWTMISHGDLTSLILCRLPVKSVLRFRSVCRRWLELTSEPTFIQSHTLSNPRPPTAGLILRSRRPNYLSLHPLPGRSSLPGPSLSFLDFISDSAETGACPLDSSNGLVLFGSPYNQCWSIPHYVCNPTTKEYRRIPNPPLMTIEGFGLFFDPSSPVCRHPILHYKLVCIGLGLYGGWDNEIMIYNSLTESWQSSGKKYPYGDFYTVGITYAVSCGGAVHLVVDTHKLLSFQMESERLQITPFPTISDNTSAIKEYIGPCQDRLQLILSYSKRPSILHIFELNQDYSGWMHLYRVNELETLSFGDSLAPVGVIGRVEEEDSDGGGMEDLLLLTQKTKDHGRKIISYDLKRSCLNKFQIFDDTLS